MSFGNKLNNLRKKHGMSQEELADMLSITRQTVSKWELGQSLPDINYLLQLCSIFNVSSDYFLNDDMNKSQFVSIVSENKMHRPQIAGIIILCISIPLLVMGIIFCSFGNIGIPFISAVDYSYMSSSFMAFNQIGEILLIISIPFLITGIIVLLNPRISLFKKGK